MKISDVRRKLKKNRFMFFTYRKLTDQDYRTNLRDFQTVKVRKSRDRIEREISLIRDYWKCDPMHYYRYRLFEKELSEEELIDYIPAYYFYNYHMPSVNNETMIPLTESKIRLNDFFRSRKIATPPSVSIIVKGVPMHPAGSEMNYAEFLHELSRSSASMFFVKPDRGMGGKGIFTIKKKGNVFILPGNEELDQKTFNSIVRGRDFLVQEAISQKSDISAIYPSSVNTLRVITQYSDSGYRIAAVVMRIGRNGSYVDNSAQGGISVNIDTESGRFAGYAFTEHSTESFDRHPGTGFIFGGYTLSNWEKIKNEILANASKAPELPEVAWDVAVQENGIVVIELNLNYGIDHLQCCIGGMRRKLNIMPVYPEK